MKFSDKIAKVWQHCSRTLTLCVCSNICNLVPLALITFVRPRLEALRWNCRLHEGGLVQSPFTVVQQCNRAFFSFFTFAMLVIHIKKYTVEKHGTQITPYLLLSEAGCGVEIERGVCSQWIGLFAQSGACQIYLCLRNKSRLCALWTCTCLYRQALFLSLEFALQVCLKLQRKHVSTWPVTRRTLILAPFRAKLGAAMQLRSLTIKG